MRTLTLATVLTFLAGAATAADPVVGLWQSEPNESGNYEQVEFSECGAKVCGTLLTSFDGLGKALSTGNEGKLIIWDMKAENGGRYMDGQLSLPDNGEGPGPSDGSQGSDEPMTAKMRLSGDRLTVSGCLVGGLICGSQIWTRVN
jgi:uncharacterized protein (DUF2147 family)